MKLPKYVRARASKYHYQRDYPLRIRELTGKKTFTYPLDLYIKSASEMEIKKQALAADEAFDRDVLLITNSDPDILSVSEIDKAAAELLRKRGLRSAQMAGPGTLYTSEGEQEVGAAYFADTLLPEIDEISYKINVGETLTAKQKVIEHAYRKLITKQKEQPRTLSMLWDEYVKYRDIDITSRGGKKSLGYWNRWISIAGDTVIGPATLDHINDGMDAYVAEREEKEVKGQSIQRELSEVLSCLRRASKKYRLGWYIELPLIKQTEVHTRLTLEPSHQIAIVKEILNKKIKPRYGVALLLCLQGGMMTSEIKRLEAEHLGLDTDIPHLKIVGKTKNKERKRIVPIVLGVDLIKEHLPDTIKWLRSVTESTPSGTLKKIIRRVTGDDRLVTHGLRHTFRSNAQVAGVDMLSINDIAGWRDRDRGQSTHMFHYGAEGIAQTHRMKALYEASLKIHSHLLPLEKSSASNVLSFRKGR